TTPPTLPIHFPHDKHTTVNCVTCHHNFVDKTGIGSCVDCHRQPRPDLTRSAEATFHTFCRDCHTELAPTTPRHAPTRSPPPPRPGPTRSSPACHVKPIATANTLGPQTPSQKPLNQPQTPVRTATAR